MCVTQLNSLFALKSIKIIFYDISILTNIKNLYKKKELQNIKTSLILVKCSADSMLFQQFHYNKLSNKFIL